MKKILRSAFSWLKTSPEEASEEVKASTQVEAAPVQAPAPSPSFTSAPAPAAPVVPPKKRVEVPVAPPPEPFDLSQLTQGTPVTVLNRGGHTYGVCPHCQATWNLRERLSRFQIARLERAHTGLTCPKCNNPVALPPSLDLRKIT